LFAIVGVFLFPVAVGVEWSLDSVGNGYQLMGVLIAGIGIPVVAPLTALEDRLGLSPMARRRLQWEVERSHEPANLNPSASSAASSPMWWCRSPKLASRWSA
jgi:hypothetical protein